MTLGNMPDADAEFRRRVDGYPLEELRQALRGVNRERFPGRARYLEAKMERVLAQGASSAEEAGIGPSSGRVDRVRRWVRTWWLEGALFFLVAFGLPLCVRITCKCERFAQEEIFRERMLAVIWWGLAPALAIGMVRRGTNADKIWRFLVVGWIAVVALWVAISRLLPIEPARWSPFAPGAVLQWWFSWVGLHLGWCVGFRRAMRIRSSDAEAASRERAGA